MSYLILLFALPAHITSVDELLMVYQPSALGSKATILGLLTDLLPDADVTDPTWVMLTREKFGIEFVVGHDDPVDSLGVRIHRADSAMAIVQLLSERTGWRAYDTSLGSLINFQDDPAQCPRARRAYSDRAITADERADVTAKE